MKRVILAATLLHNIQLKTRVLKRDKKKTATSYQRGAENLTTKVVWIKRTQSSRM